MVSPLLLEVRVDPHDGIKRERFVIELPDACEVEVVVPLGFCIGERREWPVVLHPSVDGGESSRNTDHNLQRLVYKFNVNRKAFRIDMRPPD